MLGAVDVVAPAAAVAVVALLVFAAVYLARHDRTRRVRFGVFLERERDDLDPPRVGGSSHEGVSSESTPPPVADSSTTIPPADSLDSPP